MCKAFYALVIVHYATSAMKRFLTRVSLQHEPKASDVITLVKETFFRTSIVRNFISRRVKMRISAREACVKPHLRTRSDIKHFTPEGHNFAHCCGKSSFSLSVNCGQTRVLHAYAKKNNFLEDF